MKGLSDADGFALIEMGAAVRLREMGWKKPVLLLQGFFQPGDLTVVAQYDLQIVVHCVEQIEMLEKVPMPSGVDVFLKMNSGMNRLGFTPDECLNAYSRLRNVAYVRRVTLMTHFANSYAVDANPKVGITPHEQISRFARISRQLDCESSVADSATILTDPALAGQWVRPGAMLYGATVFPGRRSEEFGLLPAMTLESEIIGVQRIGVGDSVGYGSRFVADRPMTIGVVACGYTDGYPRSATDGSPVLVNGIRTRLVGRVSMDSITVDLTSMPQAGVGSKVTLWGRGLPIEEVADASSTISCELMCGLTRRVQMLED